MESFKEKLPMILAAIIVIALIVGAYYFLVIHKDLYYTQIDNTKIQEITESGGMKYEYTLTAYNKNGKEKERASLLVILINAKFVRGMERLEKQQRYII